MGACAADRHQARRAAGSHLRPGVDSDHRRGGSKCGHIHAIANGTFLAGGNGRDDVAKAFSQGEAVAQMRPFIQASVHIPCAVYCQQLNTVLCGHNYKSELSTVYVRCMWVTLSHTQTFPFPPSASPSLRETTILPNKRRAASFIEYATVRTL